MNEKQVKAIAKVGAFAVARPRRALRAYSHVPNGPCVQTGGTVFTKIAPRLCLRQSRVSGASCGCAACACALSPASPDAHATSLLLRTLRAVEGAALHALGNASSIESAADDVVTYAREIADLAAADQHNRVLLQVVADTRDVAGTFDVVRQTNTRNFTQSGIRLLA